MAGMEREVLQAHAEEANRLEANARREIAAPGSENSEGMRVVATLTLLPWKLQRGLGLVVGESGWRHSPGSPELWASPLNPTNKATGVQEGEGALVAWRAGRCLFRLVLDLEASAALEMCSFAEHGKMPAWNSS